jgi:hypothetical protein
MICVYACAAGGLLITFKDSISTKQVTISIREENERETCEGKDLEGEKFSVGSLICS